MEVVTLLFGKAVDHGLLSPIGNCSKLQRLSIFADDVVLFVKPKIGDLVTVRELLRIFGGASGLKVNYQKTAATLIHGEEQDGTLIACVELPAY
jgi:hypothetical protein